ncbi:MAG: DUF3015 family protein [Nitrospira sp.]
MMSSIRCAALQMGLIGCLALGITACDTTVELVKAPFDATTAVSNGTTQGASELTQPTKEFTSSTTPGSRVGSEDLIRAKQRLHIFAAYNFNNLQHDIAQGHGEYLHSLLTLAQISEASYPQTLRDLQQRYVALYSSDQSPAELTRRLVDVVWLAPIGAHAE